MAADLKITELSLLGGASGVPAPPVPVQLTDVSPFARPGQPAGKGNGNTSYQHIVNLVAANLGFLISKTYAEMDAMIIGAELVPGVFYKITDKNVVVQALSTTTLSMHGAYVGSEINYCEFDFPTGEVIRRVDRKGNDIWKSAGSGFNCITAFPWGNPSVIGNTGGNFSMSISGNVSLFFNTFTEGNHTLTNASVFYSSFRQTTLIVGNGSSVYYVDTKDNSSLTLAAGGYAEGVRIGKSSIVSIGGSAQILDVTVEDYTHIDIVSNSVIQDTTFKVGSELRATSTINVTNTTFSNYSVINSSGVTRIENTLIGNSTTIDLVNPNTSTQRIRISDSVFGAGCVVLATSSDGTENANIVGGNFKNNWRITVEDGLINGVDTDTNNSLPTEGVEVVRSQLTNFSIGSLSSVILTDSTIQDTSIGKLCVVELINSSTLTACVIGDYRVFTVDGKVYNNKTYNSEISTFDADLDISDGARYSSNEITLDPTLLYVGIYDVTNSSGETVTSIVNHPDIPLKFKGNTGSLDFTGTGIGGAVANDIVADVSNVIPNFDNGDFVDTIKPLSSIIFITAYKNYI